ncbi:MAG: hypothetical protein ABI632_04325 [Pseudolysinimonas sp.]
MDSGYSGTPQLKKLGIGAGTRLDVIGDVKVAAIDNDWSGLKLVWRREVR